MIQSRSTPTLAVLASLALALSACAGSAASPTADDTPEPMATESMTAESMAPESTAPATEEPAEEPAAERPRVQLESSQFEPGEITVPAGTTVVFVNSDSFAHTVTEGTNGQAVEDPLVDRDLAGGQSVMVTFDDPGTYDITCRIHPSMQLTVTVEG